MNSRNLFLTLAVSLSMAAVAAPLTPEEALSRATMTGVARIAADFPAAMKPVYSEMTAKGSPAAYIFNNYDNGYVIVSGDDVAVPVLGYSNEGSIDVNNMSPELKWWLSEYARRIEWALDNGIEEPYRAPSAVEGRTAIEPYVKSKWDQSSPYNNMCPKKDGVLSVTGCVATSMAQLMNYYKYPEVGEGTIQYTSSSLGRRLTLNFGLREFDWDNMLNIYSSGQYSEAQADAVAYLMKACGYSTEMDYSPIASGTQGQFIANALVTYFKYDGNTRVEHRMLYSGSEWDEMIYNNLKNIGPVVLNGQSPLQGGHSFVCDGYDGNGYYHINWGWGGISDGYYALDALNPDAQGIGGYVGGFNFSQNAILGAQPPTGEPVEARPDRILLYGNAQASITGQNVTVGLTDYSPLGWGNAMDHPIDVVLGLGITPKATPSATPLYVEGKLGSYSEISISVSSYYNAGAVKGEFTLPSLEDGEYIATLSNRDVGGTDWVSVAVPWGLSNYFYVKVENGKYSVENVPVRKISVANLEVESDCFFGKNVMLKAEMSNDNDMELSQGVSAVLCNSQGQIKYFGESLIISLQPGESVEKEWITKFYTRSGSPASGSGDFVMRLINPQTNQFYEGVSIPVSFKANPGAANVMLKGFSLINPEDNTIIPMQDMTFFDNNYINVSLVPDKNNFLLNLKFLVKKGYFDGQITVNILEQNPENPNTQIPVKEGVYSEWKFMNAKEEADMKIPISFPEAENGVLYFLVANYTSGSALNMFGSKSFVCGMSGIEEIIDEEDGSVQMFNLQGMPISNPAPGQIVIVRKGGKSYRTICR